MVREDKNDKIYLTEEEKNDAIIDEIKTYHEKGNPILVGTISVENSEVLSKKLDTLNIPHRVLNAKQNQQEAEIISSWKRKSCNHSYKYGWKRNRYCPWRVPRI